MSEEKKIEALNKVQRYTQWISFDVDRSRLDAVKDPAAAAAEVGEFFAQFPKIDPQNIDPTTDTPVLPAEVVVRGVYDTSSVRAGSSFMIWWHAKELESIQQAFHHFQKTEFGACCNAEWSGTGIHHPSEFNKGHLPTFIKGEEGGDWISVYPFVRSYEWYLLDANDRRRILMEHGTMGRKYPDVKANTVYAFSLGDYEWLLAFECDELHRIVELMHSMRYTEARLHVREELPFHTGKRTDPAALAEKLFARKN